MKRITIAALAVLLCAVIFAGYTHAAAGLFKSPPTTAVTVLYDITDPLMLRPSSDGNAIVGLFNFSNADIYNGYSLRIRRLSMVNLTPVFDLGIPAQNKLTGDELTRVAMIRGFRKGVQDRIASVGKENVTDEPFSVLYRTIAQELNDLSEGKADTKICVIYSDLIENSDDANFYSASGFSELKRNPQAVIDRLERVVPLDSLSGIKIYVVFRPKSYADEVRFDYVYAMYRQMWLQKGAKAVSVGANLITQ